MYDPLTPKELEILEAMAEKYIARKAGTGAALDFAFDEAQKLRAERLADASAYTGPGHFAAYARTAAISQRRDLIRRLRVRRPADKSPEQLAAVLPSLEPDQLSAMELQEAMNKVRYEIERLGEPVRTCVVMHWLEGLPARVIEEETAIPEATVWAHLAHGMLELRKAFGTAKSIKKALKEISRRQHKEGT